MCIMLHNLCIINNEGIEEDWTVEAKIKTSYKSYWWRFTRKKMNYGSIKKNDTLEVKRWILDKDDVPILNNINDVEKNIFLLRKKMRRQMTF